jgi:Prohead core protein serine protease
MKLIAEEVQDVRYLVEEKNGKKEHFIEGVFLQAEVKNRNGRVYPFPLLEREVSRYNSNYVNKNRAFGELGHPESPTINLDRVSHMITQLYPDGKNFVGKAKIMDTPNGRIVKSLLDGGASLGVSTRGVGSLKPHNGYQLVQDDFHLATAADIVADPSAPDAFVRSIMESAEWILTDGGWKEVDYDRAKRQLKEASRADIEDVALRLFENYMLKITKI